MNSHRTQEQGAGERLALLALAQYLFVEAAIESVASIGTDAAHRTTVPALPERLIEPWRVRFSLFQQLRQASRNH